MSIINGKPLLLKGDGGNGGSGRYSSMGATVGGSGMAGRFCPLAVASNATKQ